MVSMKLMPNINFTQYELNERLITDIYTKGGEAYICLSDNPQTLFKIFINPKTSEIAEMSDNKFKKIVSLYTVKPYS